MRALRIAALSAIALGIGVIGWLAHRDQPIAAPETDAGTAAIEPAPADPGAATGRAPVPASPREERVGAETAARREERDRRREAWNERLASYRAERDAIRADAGLDAEVRAAAIENLLARSFNARERIRIRALDAMDDGRAFGGGEAREP